MSDVKCAGVSNCKFVSLSDVTCDSANQAWVWCGAIPLMLSVPYIRAWLVSDLSSHRVAPAGGRRGKGGGEGDEGDEGDTEHPQCPHFEQTMWRAFKRPHKGWTWPTVQSMQLLSVAAATVALPTPPQGANSFGHVSGFTFVQAVLVIQFFVVIAVVLVRPYVPTLKLPLIESAL